MPRVPLSRPLTAAELRSVVQRTVRKDSDRDIERFLAHEVPRQGPDDLVPGTEPPPLNEYGFPVRSGPTVSAETVAGVRVVDRLLDDLAARPEAAGRSRREVYEEVRRHVVDSVVQSLDWTAADVHRHEAIEHALPLERLHEIGRSLAGAPLQLGFGAVDEMAVRARQIVDPQHGAGIELNMRLTPQRGRVMRELFEQGVPGAAAADFRIERASLVDGRVELWAEAPFRYGDVFSNRQNAHEVVEPGRFTVGFVPSKDFTPASFVNRLRVRVFGETTAERSAALSEALARIGAQDVLAPATQEDLERWKRLSLLRMVDPKADDRYRRAPLHDVTIAQLDADLAAAGVDAARVAAARVEEVFPGQVAVVDPALGDAYAAAGLEMMIVGSSGVTSLVDMLTGPGLHATMERFTKGMHREGASTHSDMGAGGADYAFARAVTTKAIDRGESFSSWTSGNFVLVSTGDALRAQLSRADWHAYDCDNYGSPVTRWHLEEPLANGRRQAPKVFYDDREVLAGLVSLIDAPHGLATWAAGNELIFRGGLPSDAFTHVVVRHDAARAELVKALEDAGVTLAGKPAADAVIVAGDHGEIARRVGLRP